MGRGAHVPLVRLSRLPRGKELWHETDAPSYFVAGRRLFCINRRVATRIRSASRLKYLRDNPPPGTPSVLSRGLISLSCFAVRRKQDSRFGTLFFIVVARALARFAKSRLRATDGGYCETSLTEGGKRWLVTNLRIAGGSTWRNAFREFYVKSPDYAEAEELWQIGCPRDSFFNTFTCFARRIFINERSYRFSRHFVSTFRRSCFAFGWRKTHLFEGYVDIFSILASTWTNTEISDKCS